MKKTPNARSRGTQPSVTVKLVFDHGINSKEYQRITKLVKRKLTYTELGVFSAMWNEHCSYKSSKKWLRTFPTKGKNVICGPGENAGVIDIGDNDVLVFKIESHNHPSYIEPFQGAATGVGGILRDIFTMGARPIATMNSLSFGAIDHYKTKSLLQGCVKGIGNYGNSFGVPNLGGELRFDSNFNGNCLVNVFAAGLAKRNKLFYSAASGVGTPVVYVGAKTGRDGVGGATMASDQFDINLEKKRPTVQIGDPFTEKRLLEACLELMRTDAIISSQDMGAAGLTCSAVEMGSKGKLGIKLNLDKVPVRESFMSAYEMMLSETQERMLMTLKPSKEKVAKEIFDKWDLDFAIIGETIAEDRFIVTHRSKKEVDLPLQALSSSSPEYDRQWVNSPPSTPYKTENKDISALSALKILLSSPNYCSRKQVWEQYDHMVLTDTIIRPGSDAGVVRVHDTNKALAFTLDSTPRYCLVDPYEGGKQAVAEAYRNLIASGAKPLALTNNLNFGNPENPKIMGQLVGCIKGIGEASKTLEMPIVSGNVSLYNETSGRAIAPTPTIGAVGLLSSTDKLITNRPQASQNLLLLGENNGHMGQSSFILEVNEQSIENAGPPPTVNLLTELKTGMFLSLLNDENKIKAAHDVSDGGILLAIAEMVIAGNVGIKIKSTALEWCFSEDQARYLISCEKEDFIEIKELAKNSEIPLEKIGTFQGGELTVGHENISVTSLRLLYEGGLENLFS